MRPRPQHRAPARALAASIGLLLALGLAACGVLPDERDPELPAATPAGPTATPTPTARPRPPGLALRDARARAEREPVSDAAAPCGRVDRLDFPLGPPDAQGYSARWPYGRMSRRYGKLHAGEDWLALGGSSLGHPVHSVGHGRVEYAEPYGWGQTDKGVVILRHHFVDGSSVLSFYGHLEPSSITVAAGGCVRRGEQLGSVGKPRGRPHLHFELRDHLPYEPGPGYWPSDPSRAGWHPPSEFIWQRRLLDDPALRWSASFTRTQTLPPLRLEAARALLTTGRRLTAIDLADGAEGWALELDAPPVDLLLDEGGRLLYWSDRLGRLGAIELPDDAEAAARPLWQLSTGGPPDGRLLPRDGGGLLQHDGRGLVARDPEGRELWRDPQAPPPRAWAREAGRLVYASQHGDRAGPTRTGEPRLFELDLEARRARPIGLQGGQPVIARGGLFLHAAEGVYRIEPDEGAREGLAQGSRMVLPLDPAALDPGRALALPGGGLLVAHRGASTARLARLDDQGALVWERDLSDLVSRARAPELLLHSGRVLAATERGDLFAIDLEQGAADWIFDAGWGARSAGRSFASGAAEGAGPVLLDYRAGQLVALDPALPELGAEAAD